MTTINVIIPTGGSAKDPVEPILTPHVQAIPRNKMIAWHFHSENTDVKDVVVRFVDPNAKFFPNTAHPTWLKQTVLYKKNAADPVKYPGQTLIWGAAPDYGTHTKDKYVIEGVNDKGEVIALLDPYILTTKPG